MTICECHNLDIVMKSSNYASLIPYLGTYLDNIVKYRISDENGNTCLHWIRYSDSTTTGQCTQYELVAKTAHLLRWCGGHGGLGIEKLKEKIGHRNSNEMVNGQKFSVTGLIFLVRIWGIQDGMRDRRERV